MFDIIFLTDSGDIYRGDGGSFTKIERTFINPKIFIDTSHCYILHDVLDKKYITTIYQNYVTGDELDFNVETLIVGYYTMFYICKDSVYCKGSNIYYNLGLGHKDPVNEPILHPFLSGKNLLGFPNRNNVKRAN